MKSDINSLMLMGRITSDAERKTLANGLEVVSFSIANNTYWKSRDDGEVNDSVSYFPIRLYGQFGVRLHPYLRKGQQVVMDASLRQRTWTDSSGQKRSSIEIRVSDLWLTGGTRSGRNDISDEGQAVKEIPSIAEEALEAPVPEYEGWADAPVEQVPLHPEDAPGMFEIF